MSELPEPYAKERLLSVKRPYDPEPLKTRMSELLEEHNERYREAALRSGLDHYYVNRIFKGARPGIPACILLADHFEVNPNEILELAGWPKLNAFDIHADVKEDLPPEAVQIAVELAKIADPEQRKEISQAVSALLKLFQS